MAQHWEDECCATRSIQESRRKANPAYLRATRFSTRRREIVAFQRPESMPARPLSASGGKTILHSPSARFLASTYVRNYLIEIFLRWHRDRE